MPIGKSGSPALTIVRTSGDVQDADESAQKGLGPVFAGYGVHMDVSLDGIPAGQTVWDSFMVWEVSPGQHYLLSKAENDSMIPIFVASGRRYFVWQEVKMGLLFARSELHQVSDPQGLSGVSECKLVQMRSFPRRAPIPAAVPAPTPPPVTSGAAAPPTS